MASVDELVNEAMQGIELSSEELSELPATEAREIFDQAKAQFVEGNPRAWWLRLKKKPQSFDTDDASEFSFLRQHWPESEEKCYFIPENESDNPRVFDATLDAITKILGNSSFFEYYLVGKSLHWLMIENDHNELLVVKDSS